MGRHCISYAMLLHCTNGLYIQSVRILSVKARLQCRAQQCARFTGVPYCSRNEGSISGAQHRVPVLEIQTRPGLSRPPPVSPDDPSGRRQRNASADTASCRCHVTLASIGPGIICVRCPVSELSSGCTLCATNFDVPTSTSSLRTGALRGENKRWLPSTFLSAFCEHALPGVYSAEQS
ncbi:uncharacterized protein LOC117642298 isoform X3 [Thrips palmi]|uniref:Uncharacterized protein LOC117642298 isoform X3 n=1 Tax=Thrips palmi TaxID=161013 RepID=A0A6P8ZJZ9_THRPL|nr:uncharacterized protein LOC117642298 isoform X3 [Thrips palmi]